MPDAIADLVKKLEREEPPRSDLRLAAVSVIVNGADDPSVLLMKRAEHSGDPWSGQISLPGGKMQPGDASAKATAVRETMEEVGIDLAKDGEFLGYGKLTVTHTGAMQVVPVVFLLKEDPVVRLNSEATSYRWLSLGELRSTGARATHQFTYQDSVLEMPAYSVKDYLVWGLTYRILNLLVEGASGETSSTTR